MKDEQEVEKQNEPADERYELIWPGKRRAEQMVEVPSFRKLALDTDLSVNEKVSNNMYIEGDNIDALKLLQKSYFQSIKVIYIDPPYNTGQSLIYNDKFHLTNGNYSKKAMDRIDSSRKGRFHTDWLNFMYPRLVLARRLLKEDGVIFVSIDNRELANLKLIMDEIFGEENFVGNIVRATGTSTGQDSGGLGNAFDYVLVYGKTTIFDVGGIPLSQKDADRFKYEDENGRFSILQLRKTGNEDKREDRPSMYYPVVDPDGKIVFPVGPGGYESRWRFF
ncbi:MAG: site-specific DNA-methyltransferase [Bacillus sp. (in: Bacteria)]|nr:site-specific DNA-methyltransferase [Bacillus sp. (in: firmicutes)]